MQLNCPKCGLRIAVEHIDLATGLAQCRCGEVFGYGYQVAGATPPVPKPAGVTVVHAGRDFVLITRWASAISLLLLFYLLLFSGISGFGLLLYSFAGYNLSPGALLNLHIFQGIIVVVGGFMLYITCCDFINSSEIRVNGSSLSVRHFPLPWFGNMHIAVDSIQQLYCARGLHYTPSPIIGNLANTTLSRSYKVMIMKKGGERVCFLRVTQADHAAFIAQQLTQRLGLVCPQQ